MLRVTKNFRKRLFSKFFEERLKILFCSQQFLRRVSWVIKNQFLFNAQECKKHSFADSFKTLS